MLSLLLALTDVNLDPVASPAGIAVIVLGIVLLIKAIKTVVKVAMVGVILVGLYLFFYGGGP